MTRRHRAGMRERACPGAAALPSALLSCTAPPRCGGLLRRTRTAPPPPARQQQRQPRAAARPLTCQRCSPRSPAARACRVRGAVARRTRGRDSPAHTWSPALPGASRRGAACAAARTTPTARPLRRCTQSSAHPGACRRAFRGLRRRTRHPPTRPPCQPPRPRSAQWPRRSQAQPARGCQLPTPPLPCCAQRGGTSGRDKRGGGRVAVMELFCADAALLDAAQTAAAA